MVNYQFDVAHLEGEGLLAWNDVSAYLVEIGIGPRSRDCLDRWRFRGVRGVRLPVLRVGGAIFTGRRAIVWWLQHTAQTLVAV